MSVATHVSLPFHVGSSARDSVSRDLQLDPFVCFGLRDPAIPMEPSTSIHVSSSWAPSKPSLCRVRMHTLVVCGRWDSQRAKHGRSTQRSFAQEVVHAKSCYSATCRDKRKSQTPSRYKTLTGARCRSHWSPGNHLLPCPEPRWSARVTTSY